MSDIIEDSKIRRRKMSHFMIKDYHNDIKRKEIVNTITTEELTLLNNIPVCINKTLNGITIITDFKLLTNLNIETDKFHIVTQDAMDVLSSKFFSNTK